MSVPSIYDIPTMYNVHTLCMICVRMLLPLRNAGNSHLYESLYKVICLLERIQLVQESKNKHNTGIDNMIRLF